MTMLYQYLLPLMAVLALMFGGAAQNNGYTEPAVIVEMTEAPVVTEEIAPTETEKPQEMSEADKLVMEADESYDSGNYTTAYNKYFAASRLGSGTACYRLGTMTLIGDGIAQSDSAALKWFEKACELGEPDGYYGTGYMYQHGLSVVADEKKAVEQLTIGAETGSARCMAMLGDYSFYGTDNCPQDFSKAFEWYSKGGELENSSCLYMLAYCSYYGIGTEEDYQKGYGYLERGANAGSIDAYAFLGYVYYKPLGVEKDMQKAVEYYTVAANAGMPYALSTLGDFYYYGYVDTDFELAFKYYLAAAELGYSYAEYSVGYAYIYGEGVEENYDEGVKWLRLAADAGIDYAKEELEKLGEIGEPSDAPEATEEPEAE